MKEAKDKILEVGEMDEKSSKFESAVGALNQFVNQTPLSCREIGGLRARIQVLVDRAVAVRNERVENAISKSKEIVELVKEKNPPFVVQEFDLGADRNALSKAVVELRTSCPETCFLLCTRDLDTAIIMTSCPKGAKIPAGEWAKVTISKVKGKGGGNAESGQGNGSNPNALPEALEEAKSFAQKKIE